MTSGSNWRHLNTPEIGVKIGLLQRFIVGMFGIEA
jgi:hypothetical protein